MGAITIAFPGDFLGGFLDSTRDPPQCFPLAAAAAGEGVCHPAPDLTPLDPPLTSTPLAGAGAEVVEGAIRLEEEEALCESVNQQQQHKTS